MFDKNNWYIEEKELTEDQYREVCKYLVSNYPNREFYTGVERVAEGDTLPCKLDATGVIDGEYYVHNLPCDDFEDCVKITYQEFEQYLLNGEVTDQSSENNPWIDWVGGECPVEVGTDVDVMYRNGDVNYHVKAGVYCDRHGSIPDYSAFNWTHSGVDLDIIKYRLHKLSEDSSTSLNTKSQENTENVSQSLVESFKTLYSSCEDYGVELTFNHKGVVEIYADCGEYFVDFNEEGSDSKLTEILEAVKVLNKADKL